MWRLYLAGSVLAFESNRLGVNQVLAVRPGGDGRSGMPRTRDELLGRLPGPPPGQPPGPPPGQPPGQRATG